jgi:hypothetical protein
VGRSNEAPVAIAATSAIAAAIPATGRYDPTPVTDTETPGTETAVTNAELADRSWDHSSVLPVPIAAITHVHESAAAVERAVPEAPTDMPGPFAEQVAGGTEGEATVPQLGDEAEPFQMLLVADGGPAATIRLGEDVDGLVEADRARRHPGAAWWPGSAPRSMHRPIGRTGPRDDVASRDRRRWVR